MFVSALSNISSTLNFFILPSNSYLYDEITSFLFIVSNKRPVYCGYIYCVGTIIKDDIFFPSTSKPDLVLPYIYALPQISLKVLCSFINSHVLCIGFGRFIRFITRFCSSVGSLISSPFLSTGINRILASAFALISTTIRIADIVLYNSAKSV